MAFGDENLQELLDEVFMSFPILENVKKPIDFSETEQSQIKNITKMGGLGQGKSSTNNKLAHVINNFENPRDSKVE